MDSEDKRNRRILAILLAGLAVTAAVLAGLLVLLGPGRTAAPAGDGIDAGSYGFDRFLAQGGGESNAALEEFLAGRGVGGRELAEAEKATAGVAFTALDDATGHRLLARGHQSVGGRFQVVRTAAAPGRHATVSTVDLAVIDPQEGLSDRALALAAPYFPLDGMNDAGFACAVLATSGQGGREAVATHQTTQRPDLTAATLARLLLDSAESVDQAIDMAGQYDLHGDGFHILVADAKGDSAVLEWLGDTWDSDTDGTCRRLRVTRVGGAAYQSVTNYVLYEGYYAGASEADLLGLDRNRYLSGILSSAAGRLEGGEKALELLGELVEPVWLGTEELDSAWGVVYDLTGRALCRPGEGGAPTWSTLE